MKKSVRAGMLALALVALLSVGAAFTVQAAPAEEAPAVQLAAECAVLKQGSTGADVKTVQQKLKRWGYYSGNVDGIYGSRTKKAVEWFQRKNRLTVDGIVGPPAF